MHSTIDTSRRSLLKGGSAAAVAAAFGGPIAALAARVAHASADGRGGGLAEQCQPATASALIDSPYGPTAPVNDLTTGLPLIELPAGFSHKSHGWRGDVMSDGLVTPAAHDGMGVVRERRMGRSLEITLVRNHALSTNTNAANIIGASSSAVPKFDTGLTGTSYQIGGNTPRLARRQLGGELCHPGRVEPPVCWRQHQLGQLAQQ